MVWKMFTLLLSTAKIMTSKAGEFLPKIDDAKNQTVSFRKKYFDYKVYLSSGIKS